MPYIILGHSFQILGIFFAFLATVITIFYAYSIRGGTAGRVAALNSLGFTILAVDIFLTYTMSITGNLDLLNVTIFWPILGFLTCLGFAIIAYAQFRLWRIIKK